MNQSQNNSNKLDKPYLNLRQIISKSIYPIEVLLKLYKPLNVPRSIFKLEPVVQKINTYSSNNFSYARNTGSIGQNPNYLEKKQKNGYFTNHNKSYNTFESNHSSPGNSKVSDEKGISGIADSYSWRKSKPIKVDDNINNHESIQNNQTKPRRINKKSELITSFSTRNQISDLEEDMTSIEKILNKRFEKESIDSEKFIRNKLVMALEGIDAKSSNNRSGEILSGIINGNEKNRLVFPDKSILVGSDLIVEKAQNLINNDLKELSPLNNFYHGNCKSVDSRLFKSNIVKNNILNGKFTNNSRAVQSVNCDSDINIIDSNRSIESNNINFNLAGIEANNDTSLINSFQSACNNLRIDNQLIQNQQNIGLEIKQEIDMLDNPIWLYKESGSFTVNGPCSTKQMSSLWKSYTFTHKTLFTMTSKYTWGPINLFYPDVKSTFTYIPDLEVISQRLTDISFQSDKVEKIKSEDISSIISEINELQLNVSDHISAPKLINNTINNSEKVNKNSITEKSNSCESDSNKYSVQVLKNDGCIIESQKNEKSCEFEQKIQSSSTKVPWGKIAGDNSKTKKEVINFQDILREEEIFSKERLRIEAINRANNSDNNSDTNNNKSVPKGWKSIPKEKPSVFLDSINEQESQGYDTVKQNFSQFSSYSTNLNMNSENKWKGWGKKTVEPTNTEIFEAITLNSTNNFPTNQKGFWEMCNSESLQKSSVWGGSINRDVTCNKVSNDSLSLEVIDRKAECSFDEIDGTEINKDFYDKESTLKNAVKPSNIKNKRKKGKKVESSLLAFGIRSDRPRNLNYDLD